MTRPASRRANLPVARAAVTVAVVVALAAALLAGCSGSGSDAGGGGDTIASAEVTLPDSCEQVEPGLVVSGSLATVYFDPETVCPGWITVEQGTQVTFTNRGSQTATVVITADQMPGSDEVARFTIPAGGSQPLDTLQVSRMGFSTDALPGFRGTVEVVEPGSSSTDMSH